MFNRVNSVFEDFMSEDILELGRLVEGAFTRERVLHFNRVACFMLNKNGLSQSMEVYNFFSNLNIPEFTREAFYQARMKFNPLVFKKVNDNYLERFYKTAPVERFKGYIVLGIDGCVADLPNHRLLKGEYGGIIGTDTDIIKTKAQTSGVYDCLNHMMIDFQIAPYKTSEKELSKYNMKNALKHFKKEEQLLIFDRGYPSFELFHYLISNNIKFIARVKNNQYKKEKKKIKSNNGIMNIELNISRLNHIKDEKTKKNLLKMGDLELRLIKIPKKDEEIHLITNFSLKEANYEEITELYRKRWEIEKSFEVLKNKLYLENISGYTKIAIEQDFYSQILTYNMVQDIKNYTDNILREKQRHKRIQEKAQKTLKKKKNNHNKKVNTNYLIGLFRKNILQIFKEKDYKIALTIFKEMIEKSLKIYIYEVPERKFKKIKRRVSPKNKTNIRRNS
ncbi:IS4 family transposase [Methanobrevibacter cuticularis]|uniref:IS4 family transposase n=1 Tax=Methanobrevibacter cuticularis TaxID=47311 RepID=UPI0014725744|nr:IS4 family transposase [Methanobrevibacter cuticularis]